MRDIKDNKRSGDGWVYPEKPHSAPRNTYGYDAKREVKSRNAQNRPPSRNTPLSRSQAPRGAAPSAVRERPVAPSHSGNAPYKGGSGARRTPMQFGSAPRAGVRTHEAPPDPQNRKKIIAISLVIAVIAIVMVFIFPKLGKTVEMPERAESDTVMTEETVPETEPEPEVPAKTYTYATRTDATVQLGAEISCTRGILIDVGENRIIAEKGGDEVMYPASMTKVMTALAAVEKCQNPGSTFTMTNEIVGPLFQANASVAGFAPGEVLTFKDLLYGAILPSGADGTGGLAELVAGSEAAFADVMNAKAAELGLKNTHFTNASGLHGAEHYSTCHEIAIIFEAAMDNETVAAALGSAEYITSKTEQHPDGIELHHTLLFERLDGSEEFDGKIEVIGGKTGYTDEAGNCLVTMARVKETGKTYVFVCAGGENKWKPVFDTIHVYRKYLGVQYDGEYVPKSQR